MNRVLALVTAAALGLTAFSAPHPPAAAKSASASKTATPPNVIVILADDMGYADISAYGAKRISTPNIDRIGLQGVRFTDGYASAPVCGPSRAGIQTGRYQDRFGYEYNNGPPKRDVEQNLGLPPDEMTMGEALRRQGYHTALIGKWHLGSNDAYYPTNRGYQEFVGFLTGDTAYMRLGAPGLHYAPTGDVALPTRTPESQIVEGAGRTVVHNEDEYLTEYFGRRAVEYVTRAARSDRPYFLMLTPNAAHTPLMATQKYYDRFPQIADDRMRTYAAMISALDDMVGEVLDAVDASGEADNTIVFFLTDNGCAAYIPGICSCEPLRGGKLSHYEGGVRVPMMVRWPAKLKPGQVNREVVSSLDIFPTVLAAAGGTLPKDRIYDGVDLTPYLTGDKAGPPHDLLAWRRRPMASIRVGDWKLWKSLDGKFTLLFNLKDDLNERTNLAESRPDKLRELEAAYDQWAKDLQDPRWPSRPPRDFDVCGTPFRLPI
jgi:arylsulfatase A-like enzyme